jgi:hypothetical protein
VADLLAQLPDGFALEAVDRHQAAPAERKT